MAYFAASVDAPETNRKFADELALDYPLLSDPTRETAKAYGLVRDDKSSAVRTTFYVGTDGRILYVDRQVSPSNHGEAVAARLAALGVKRRAVRRR